jgi:transposase InsO family protein
LVGLFKKAKGGFTHIAVAVDKFTKWIEVKLATSITSAKAVEFIKEIMYKFGIPNNIITDNGTQFTMRELKDFCVDSGIKINYASVSHSQSNGQVERSNVMILQGLKPRIFDRLKPYARKWVKELPSVLWGLRTSHVMPWATHHFLYFMDLRQCCPPKWSTNLSTCNISMKCSQMTYELMI